MMKNLNRTLVHSAELAKMLSHALEVNTPDSVEEARVGRLIATMQAQATQMEELLQRLSNEYAVEVNTTKLRLWERKLLDLTLRNNLLNMRMGKNCLPYVHPDIAQLEDELAEGKELLLEQKELKGLYRAVRTQMEETGANTLFLTLGTLKWEERDGARQYMAPILLMPIEMVQVKKDSYAIRRRDEETIINITLLEFLHQQFDIRMNGLHPLPQDAHGIDVSLVLHTLRQAVKEHPTWEVTEESVIGIFSFTKFVMWNDLHTHSTAMLGSDIVRSLIDGRLLVEDSTPQVDARELDMNARPDAYALPVDADSSQMEAVVESGQGRTFILYGPPGTGKSQTITNLISNAVYQGKRVLFVAQKRAALEVVQSRLEKIGMGPFCMELHSNKMDKRHFLQQIQRALEATAQSDAEEYRRKADDLYVQRMQLIGYVEALHRRQEQSGLSLSDCIERFMSVNAAPMAVDAKVMERLSDKHAHALRDKILQLNSVDTILGIPLHEHPLRGMLPKRKPEEKKGVYISPLLTADTVDKYLPTLAQTVEAVKQQMERNQKIGYMARTTRQYLESDYKWKKFMAVAQVDASLLDDIEALATAVERWNSNMNLLPQWQRYADMFHDLNDSGLAEAVKQYAAGVPVDAICDSFMAAYYQSKAQEIITADPTLKEFDGLMFENLISRYTRLVRDFQQLTRQELVARVSAGIPLDTRDAALSSELTLLRKRIANKGRGASIRNIIDQMPHLMPSLCPVMLMSPLSVAQYLDVDASKFDLVVFDEASQMPTSEAIGSLARARAAVIVGDPKQMPPTSFFAVNSADEETVDMDDLESILDDCISLSMPTRYLGWHYRSKHESLIAFSNINYYDNRLVTFPSADDMVSHVTWQHVEGFYDYGKTRTNRAEAEAIAAEVIRRMQEQPERSIGIVAFSKQQSDLIEDVLAEQMSKYPHLEHADRVSHEPLFVKNLENVQGDERDVILFSVGYGPDQDGRVSMNFGPLNKAGGERRLNVAVSRARYEMKVFSTLRPEQIDERRTQAEGVLGLKRFLQFAQQGSEMLVSTAKAQDSLMVQQIASRLEELGYEVKTAVGTSAFKVDVAVVDPANRDRFLLGIICDGEGYYRLKTVRDREVVQPSVLRMLGWNLMHIWSIDWLLHQDMILKRVDNRIREIKGI
ncbi:MAG: DUF4011 domain-containing protein [Bacteroidaceae bacterium]|nr:DUF4011 domain-containing protein [Bacteroidaceae bacterium]